MCCVGDGFWEAEPDLCAFIYDGVDLELSAQPLHERFGEEETQSMSFACGFRRKEWLSKSMDDLLGNSCSTVFDRDHEVFVVHRREQMDRTLFGGGFFGVVEEST